MTRGLRGLTCHSLSGNHEPANEMNPDWQPYTPKMRLSNMHMLDSKFKVGCKMHPKPSFHTHINGGTRNTLISIFDHLPGILNTLQPISDHLPCQSFLSLHTCLFHCHSISTPVCPHPLTTERLFPQSFLASSYQGLLLASQILPAEKLRSWPDVPSPGTLKQNLSLRSCNSPSPHPSHMPLPFDSQRVLVQGARNLVSSFPPNGFRLHS